MNDNEYSYSVKKHYRMFSKVKKFPDYIINRNVASRLDKLFGNDNLMNVILSGPSGSGKLTLARSVVASQFPDNEIVVSPVNYRTRIQDGSMKDFDILASSVHHEIPLNSYNFNDKFSVINILVNIIENRNIMNNSYHIIIIKNAEFLNDLALKAVIKLTEKYSSNVRLILTSTNSSRICKILSNFISVRVPLEDIKVREAYFKETYGSRVSDDIITDNLLETTINCERLTLEENNGISGYIDIVGNHFKILFRDIKGGNVNKFSAIRDTISDILCLNVETTEIFHRFTEEFGGSFENVKILTKYNENIQKTFKVPVHLEALSAELMALNATNSKK